MKLPYKLDILGFRLTKLSKVLVGVPRSEIKVATGQLIIIKGQITVHYWALDFVSED